MKKNRTINVICSIVVLLLLIGGIIFLLKTLSNQTVAIIGSIIMGVLGLSVAAYLIKELFSCRQKCIGTGDAMREKPCNKSCGNIWATILYIIISIILIGLCIYFFISSSRVNYIIGIVTLVCLVLYTIYYIVQRNKK